MRTDYAFHFGGVGLDDSLTAAGDAGVVDENVDVPKVGEDLLHEALVRLPVID